MVNIQIVDGNKSLCKALKKVLKCLLDDSEITFQTPVSGQDEQWSGCEIYRKPIHLANLVEDIKRPPQKDIVPRFAYYSGTTLDLYLEHSLEILHQCMTPHGFPKAARAFRAIESDVNLVNQCNQGQRDFKQAKQIFERMRSDYEGRLDKVDVFDSDYVEQLKSLRKYLLGE